MVSGAWSWRGRRVAGTLKEQGAWSERTRHGLVMEEGDSSVGRRQAGGGCAGSTGWDLREESRLRQLCSGFGGFVCRWLCRIQELALRSCVNLTL